MDRGFRDANAEQIELPIATMHLAKGFEYRAVVVMACNEGVLPLSSRIEAVADEVELDDVYETERHLFYVACARRTGCWCPAYARQRVP